MPKAGHIYHTAILGTGFGGLCMAAKLKEKGQDDFILLEKADALGGTWRENTYPGAECDIPSALYSYSFYPNPTWEFKWAKQPQILKYLNDFAADYGLADHMRFGHLVTGASFDDKAGIWTIHIDGKPDIKARFFVCAVGQLHHPNTPKFTGASSFAGPSFHSAQWDHSVDLTDKNVAVIGNAASAIQLIPEVQKIAKQLTVYQRTPNWIIGKGDRPYWGIEKAIAKAVPGIAQLYRAYLWALGEFFLWPVIQGKRFRAWLAEGMARRNLKKSFPNKAECKKLIPDYPIGAKRVLLSDKYYPALAEDNVELVTNGISRITKTGITAQDGTARKHDVIVYATGFQTQPFLSRLKVTGQNGQFLSEHWSDGARAFLGLMVTGFPNMFILYGPNTNTGHTSIVYKHEAQVAGILKLMESAGQGTINVTPEAEAEYDREMQSRLKDLAWSKVAASWYKDGDRVTHNWPGPSREYRRRASSPSPDHFRVQP